MVLHSEIQEEEERQGQGENAEGQIDHNASTWNKEKKRRVKAEKDFIQLLEWNVRVIRLISVKTNKTNNATKQ